MASTYLTRTFSSAGNRKKWTMSMWVKRSGISSGANNILFQTFVGTFTFCTFDSNDRFQFGDGNGGNKVTSMKFRDTSAWYHIVVVVDTDNATADDRYKIYINGERITAFDTSTNPSQGYEGEWNKAQEHNIGRHSTAGTYHNGLMTHIHFCDGQAYQESDFGETDTTTGIWKPKTAPSVTYGTNGFFLKFENSGAFGTDSSGNANNFTVNGTMTQTIDTPSNVFATWNPLFPNSGLTFSNGNLGVVANDANYRHCVSTLGASSGKYYAEFKAVSGFSSVDKNVGIYRTDNNYSATTGLGNYTTGTTWSYGANGLVRTNNGTNDTESTFTDGDIISVAMDLDNNKLYFAKNGTWINSGDPTSGATGTGAYTIISNGEPYHFGATSISSGGAGLWQANFGNGYFGTTAVSSAQNPDDGIGIFEHTPPTGYKALCTKSINAQEYD